MKPITTTNQKAGFEARAGKGFGKFRREQAYWAWEIHWRFSEHGRSVVHGTDGGLYVLENEGPFERLRKRFINGVLLNRNGRTGKYYSQLISHVNLFYINPESEKKTGLDLELDVPISTILFRYTPEDVNMEEPNMHITLSEATAELFGLKKRNYIKLLLEEAHTTILARAGRPESWQERLKKVQEEEVSVPLNPKEIWHRTIKPFQRATELYEKLLKLKPLALHQDTITFSTTMPIYEYFEKSDEGFAYLTGVMHRLRTETEIPTLKIEYVL